MEDVAFFWGKHGEIFFSGWPGNSTGMYVLALALTFTLTVLVEFLSQCQLIRNGPSRITGGLTQTVVHAIRAGLSLLIMLALMSLNGGVFVTAILGHMIGFLIFRSGAFRKLKSHPALYVKISEPPSVRC